ncbi:DUF6266 family protein [Pedobacter sp. MC2016-14]|uniref:DUF6266 family protein n=1 Tax=Pedobacter sp. MC2016-14 TaxID=2897327 RepID=UPI001E423637|nr:DUF6266 family protein [Pedobacter sp. MC2016-14]MCD0489544.1 DUF6266 family protein [Pedobacter sp. MC2016-14]
MAILENGILGNYKGKLGSTVGRVVNGRNVLTGLHDASIKPLTIEQLGQQCKMGLVSSFLNQGSNLIKRGFKPKKKIHTPMNMAVQYNLKHAITGNAPDLGLVYPNIVWSIGDLKNPFQFNVIALPEGVLKFSWTHSQPISEYAQASDQLMVFVYNATKERFTIVENATERASMEFVLTLPADLAGNELHVYSFFTGYKGRSSNSIYSQIKLY